MTTSSKRQPSRDELLAITGMSLMDGLKQVLKDDLMAGLGPRFEAVFGAGFISALSALAPLVVKATDLDLALGEKFGRVGVYHYAVVEGLGVAIATMIQGRAYDGDPEFLLRHATEKLHALAFRFVFDSDRSASSADIRQEIARVLQGQEAPAVASA